MRRLLPLAALLAGCLLTEEIPEDVRASAVGSASFQARCEGQRIAHAVGCALMCGPGASPTLGVEEAILDYVGLGATFEPREAEPFQVLVGETAWLACAPNTLGGLECEAQRRDYALYCLSSGVGVGDPEGHHPGQPVIPAEILDASPLSVMGVGAFNGEPGGCLADCVAAATRPTCDQCGEGEGCLETAFGSVCHPFGAAAAGEPCGGHQACASLRCGFGDLCE